MPALCLIVACGPRTLATDPPLAETSDDPWVKQHRQLVRAGCDCDSSSCFEDVRAKIVALEADHGGLDESPADVHYAHGEFEECYRGGTRDPIRDLEAVKERMCGCADEGCVKQSMIARLHFEDKYGSIDPSGEQGVRLGELDGEYNECKDAKIVSGDKLASHFEKVMWAVCECAASNKCGTSLTDLPEMPAAPLVTNLDQHKPRIEQATERLCNCALNAQLFGTYGGFVVARKCKPKEE